MMRLLIAIVINQLTIFMLFCFSSLSCFEKFNLDHLICIVDCC